ncbi:MAG: von Willebrand factor type A domain-containing protein [Opitutae bacterium]|nr:von Willebrand factor type A domain-containing protein [Opitutae bacterium]
MNPISRDDPKVTAYALGELDHAERAEVEAALQADPVLRAEVEKIRATAKAVEVALATEAGEAAPGAAAAPVGRAAIIAGGSPKILDGGKMSPLLSKQTRKILRFPSLYFVIGGLAAAGFAVMFALYEPPQKNSPEKRYVAVTVAPEGNKAGEVAAPKFVEAAAPEPVVASAPALSVPSAVLDHQFKFKLPELDLKTAGKVPVGLKVAVDPQSFEQKRGTYAGGLNEATKLAAADTTALILKQSGRDTEVLSADSVAARKTKAATYRKEVTTQPVQLASSRVYSYPPDEKFAIPAVPRVGSDLVMPPDPRWFKSPKDLLPAEPSAPPPRVRLNTEDYAHIRDNAFCAVSVEPLSTFSVEVDTASYTNVRLFLAAGKLPPRDAVRIEELVNFFPYRYAPPATAEQPFAASLEVAAAPWQPQHRLVRIGLKGREVSEAARPAANLVFLLDVSGSMAAADRLPLAKDAMRLLVQRLRPDDRVAIVTYAGASGLALPSTPVARSAEILTALDALTASGSTNGAQGIHLAYDIAKANAVAGGLNRVILCTDGDFNVGVTSQGELVHLIEDKAKSGVFLTVLGFGRGNLKDTKLEGLASKGNGTYGYVDNASEARRLLVDQFAGTLVTIAKDVKVQVEFNPATVGAYRLIGYENRLLRKEDFANDKIDAGEIGAGHTVTALYEVVPAGAAAERLAAVEPLKYQKPGVGTSQPDMGAGELLTVKIRYKEPAGDTSRRLEFALTDRGATWEVASEDFKFAAAVAGFGMILRDSPHKGSATLAAVGVWSRQGLGDDPGGYRSQFLGLVESARAVVQ